MDLLLFLLGGFALVVLVRWWRGAVPRWVAIGYLALAGLFWSPGLATRGVQVPVDSAYFYHPWSDTQTQPVVAGNGLLGDVIFQMVPFRTLVRERLLRGEAPLWAHSLFTGQPLLGNAQSAPFAPLHLMALPLPPVRAITLAAAWQMLLCLLLMDALLRALGAGTAAAVLGAVAFALCPFLVSFALYPLGMAASFLPGVVLGILALWRGERGGLAGLVACALALALSGHPETIAHAAVLAGCVAGALLLQRGPRPRWRFLGVLGAAAVLTGLLAAPVLLPFVQVLPETARWQAVKGTILTPPWVPADLRVVVDPLVYGSPRDGIWTRAGANFHEISTAWVGLVPLALALAGVADRRRGWIVLGGALALAVALGVPGISPAAARLPVVSLALPVRYRLLWCFALAVAAALAVDELPRRARGRWALVATLVAAAAALALVPPPDLRWERAWWIATLGGGAVALATLLIPRARPAFAWVAVGVVLADLALLGVRYNAWVSPRFDLAPPPVLRPLLAAGAGAGSTKAGPFRVLGAGGSLNPNLAAIYGIWDPRPNDPIVPAATVALIDQVWGYPSVNGVGGLIRLEHEGIGVRARGGDAAARPLLDYLGVRYFLAPPRWKLPLPWQRVWRHAGGQMWENPAALPLFFVPASVEIERGRGEAVARAAAIRDFRALAVAEGDPTSPREQRGGARLRRVTPNGFVLDLATPSGALVVSSVSFMSGWRIDVDGRAVRPRRVNGGFLGFDAPPRARRAVVDYRPAGWTWGLALAGLGAVLAVGLAGLDYRRRRRATPV
ncbi:MAG TPA: hypothetical protein VGV61_11850 [Thermoanaerobaculia bacterium]|nr:hypothetical protein [Thermoanaerobaculia bacterium]